jgi:hypothetical protein
MFRPTCRKYALVKASFLQENLPRYKICMLSDPEISLWVICPPKIEIYTRD